MSSELKLVELMGARFCHDLAGPLSAVNNGLEFLREDNPIMREKALELIETSSRESVHRLQFFRQAYGVVPLEGEADISYLKELADNFFSVGKITLDWPDQHTTASGLSISHSMGRLVLNLIIIAASALIHGGTISIRLTKLDDSKRITLYGDGRDIKVIPDIGLILAENKECPMTKQNVQIHFTAQLARAMGVKVQVEETGSSLQLAVERTKSPLVQEGRTSVATR